MPVRGKSKVPGPVLTSAPTALESHLAGYNFNSGRALSPPSSGGGGSSGQKRARVPGEPGVEPSFFCPSCDATYRSSTGLYLHKKEHHPELLEGKQRVRNVANFLCEEEGCEKTFVTYGGLYQHKRAHHPWLIESRPALAADGNPAKRPRGRPRECDRELADLKFECPACDKRYASYCGLYQHKRAHHPELCKVGL